MKKHESLLWRIIELALACIQARSPRLRFIVGPVTLKTRTLHTMQLTITNEEKVKVTLNPVTPGGHPTTVDGTPDWSVQSGDVTLEQAQDGLSCEIISGDNPGAAEVLVEADADLGSGTVTITGLIQVNVTGAQATNLGLTAGNPEPKN